MTRVLAFAVLPDDHPVQVARGTFPEGGFRAPEDAGWAHVSVLLEGLADCETETPEGDVVGDVCGYEDVVMRCLLTGGLLTWCADGTEENCIVFLQLVQAAVGNVFPGLFVGL